MDLYFTARSRRFIICIISITCYCFLYCYFGPSRHSGETDYIPKGLFTIWRSYREVRNISRFALSDWVIQAEWAGGAESYRLGNPSCRGFLGDVCGFVGLIILGGIIQAGLGPHGLDFIIPTWVLLAVWVCILCFDGFAPFPFFFLNLFPRKSMGPTPNGRKKRDHRNAPTKKIAPKGPNPLLQCIVIYYFLNLY